MVACGEDRGELVGLVVVVFARRRNQRGRRENDKRKVRGGRERGCRLMEAY